MKIFLTGSSGFLGQHITKELNDSYEIYHMKSNLKDHSSVNEELLQADPDYIMHLGARTEVGKSFAAQVDFSHVNYTGSVNLIENATRLKNLKNFIFASTMEVYGWQPISDEIEKNDKPAENVVFDEHTQPNPNAPYAVAKYGVEKYLEYAHRSFGLPFTALRQTNAYGRTDNDYFVTEQIVTQMLKKQSIIRLGYAKPYRNFIFVTDVIDAWKEVLVNSNKCNDGKIFTIGPNNPIQIKEYVKFIAKKIGWDGEVMWNTKEHRPGEIYWLNSDSKLIEKTIGWKPKVSLSDGIDKTIDIWKKEYAR